LGQIWDYGEHRREHVILDSSDGEEEFDQELRSRAVGRVVLDIGLGSGKFTLKIARKAKQVTGIDSSTIGLAQARMNITRTGLRNADFRLDASRLPSSANGFDVVCSRRGPGSETSRTLSEVYRALRKNRIFMQIEIGERDKQNLARIFRPWPDAPRKRPVFRHQKETVREGRFQKYCDTRLCRNRSLPWDVGSRSKVAICADNSAIRSTKG
jgi:ubiquinone/menaquinone biosynthesis C-methylase UbiE